MFFPYSSEQLPEAKETQKQLSDVELFIPIPPIDDGKKEYLDIVVPSLKLFWPMDELKIFFLTDKEKGPDVIQPFSEELKASLPGAAQIRVDSNTPPFEIEGAGSRAGWNRQQYYMFWADNYTEAEYIGFWDTDSMLSTRILPEDLFDGDKPRVLALMVDGVCDWTDAHNRHKQMTGHYDVMQAMSYFPVVVKKSDLKLIRESLTKSLDCQTFDEAFPKILAMAKVDDTLYMYSQFTLMMNILYRERPDDYAFHLYPADNRAVNPATAKVPETHLTPYPRVAQHFNYLTEANAKRVETFKKENPNIHGVYAILRDGYCYSQQNPEALKVCQDIDVENTVNHWEWEFEFNEYYKNWPADQILAAHRKRRALIKSKPPFAYRSELFFFFNPPGAPRTTSDSHNFG
eukprot:jgi/Psemu1/291004/fgenesh1_pg.601_\